MLHAFFFSLCFSQLAPVTLDPNTYKSLGSLLFGLQATVQFVLLNLYLGQAILCNEDGMNWKKEKKKIAQKSIRRQMRIFSFIFIIQIICWTAEPGSHKKLKSLPCVCTLYFPDWIISWPTFIQTKTDLKQTRLPPYHTKSENLELHRKAQLKTLYHLSSGCCLKRDFLHLHYQLTKKNILYENS